MRKTASAIAASLIAAFMVTACDEENPVSPVGETAKDEADMSPEEKRAARLREISGTVSLKSVSRAYDNPALAAALEDARAAAGDKLENDLFLSAVFLVNSMEDGLKEVTTIGYCEEFAGNRSYVDECTEEMRMRLAITNVVYSSGLASTVPTNNPGIREHALVSYEWLRSALGNYKMEDNYYFVTDIKNPEAPKLP